LSAVLFYGFIALLAWFTFRVLEPFLEPLCWAVVLVVVFDPLKARLERHWGKTWAAAACTVFVTLILIVPSIGIAMAFIHQGLEASGDIQKSFNAGGFAWVERGWAWIVAHAPGQTPANLSELLHRAISSTAEFLATRIGVVIRNVAIFVFDLAVALLAMFYLFRDGSVLVARLRRMMPFEEAPRDEMLERARHLVFASVTSSLAVAAVHGLFGGLAFAIVGIAAPVFWGVIMAFLSLVPAVGDLIIWIPAMIALAARGHWGQAIFLLIVLLLVGLVDNVMRPIFISGRAQMGGLWVFIGVIGGISVFGMLGIILGPIIVAMAASVMDLYAAPKVRKKNNGADQVGEKNRGVLE
jgi:predicted PurR-regulated permease PerM